MQRRIFLPLVTAIAVVGVGCGRQTTEAASGAPPAISVPVGPIPGVGQEPRLDEDPYATNTVALAEGRQLFIYYNCYGCHGGHGGGGMGPSLRDPVWIYGSSDAHVFDSIAQGRGKGMPAWGVRLSQDQIWKLVAYVKSMNTPLEPNPPVQR